MPGNLEQKIDEFVQSLQCRSPRGGTYPPTKVADKNPKDGEKLLDAYAGHAGEVSAVMQYFDHSLRFGQDPAGKTLLCVAMTEMRHLALLGELIANLGSEAKYYSADHSWWSGQDVYYGSGSPDGADRARLLENDIKIEREAINGYDRLLKEIREPEVLAVLRQIRADEEEHIRLFEDSLAKFKPPVH